MTFLDIAQIETLEEYIYALGACSVSLETLFEVQNKALKLNFLESDEREQVETIRYEIKRSFHAIQSLLNLMGERADVNIESIGHKMQEKIRMKLKETT